MVFKAFLIDVENKNVVKKVTHFFSFSVLTRAKLAKFTVEHFRIRRRFSSDKFGIPTKCKAIRLQIKNVAFRLNKWIFDFTFELVATNNTEGARLSVQ